MGQLTLRLPDCTLRIYAGGQGLATITLTRTLGGKGEVTRDFQRLELTLNERQRQQAATMLAPKTAKRKRK